MKRLIILWVLSLVSLVLFAENNNQSTYSSITQSNQEFYDSLLEYYKSPNSNSSSTSQSTTTSSTNSSTNNQQTKNSTTTNTNSTNSTKTTGNTSNSTNTSSSTTNTGESKPQKYTSKYISFEYPGSYKVEINSTSTTTLSELGMSSGNAIVDNTPVDFTSVAIRDNNKDRQISLTYIPHLGSMYTSNEDYIKNVEANLLSEKEAARNSLDAQSKLTGVKCTFIEFGISSFGSYKATKLKYSMSIDKTTKVVERYQFVEGSCMVTISMTSTEKDSSPARTELLNLAKTFTIADELKYVAKGTKTNTLYNQTLPWTNSSFKWPEANPKWTQTSDSSGTLKYILFDDFNASGYLISVSVINLKSKMSSQTKQSYLSQLKNQAVSNANSTLKKQTGFSIRKNSINGNKVYVSYTYKVEGQSIIGLLYYSILDDYRILTLSSEYYENCASDVNQIISSLGF